MDYNNNDFNNSNSNSTGNGYDGYNNGDNNWQREPYQMPVNVPRDNMSTAALVCGLLSIILCITGVFSLPIGALGIIFALLSRRKGMKMSLMSKIGVWMSSVGVLFAVLAVSTVLAMMPTLLQDPEYRELFNNTYEQIYGEDFDSFLEDSYGIKIQ